MYYSMKEIMDKTWIDQSKRSAKELFWRAACMTRNTPLVIKNRHYFSEQQLLEISDWMNNYIADHPRLAEDGSDVFHYQRINGKISRTF